MLIKAAAESRTSPDWEFIAARLLMLQTREQVRRFWCRAGHPGFYEKITYLEKEGLYGRLYPAHYTEAELTAAASRIDANGTPRLITPDWICCSAAMSSGRRHEIVENPAGKCSSASRSTWRL